MNIKNTELIIKNIFISIKVSPVDKNNTITAPLKNIKKIVIGNKSYLSHIKTFYVISSWIVLFNIVECNLTIFEFTGLFLCV